MCEGVEGRKCIKPLCVCLELRKSCFIRVAQRSRAGTVVMCPNEWAGAIEFYFQGRPHPPPPSSDSTVPPPTLPWRSGHLIRTIFSPRALPPGTTGAGGAHFPAHSFIRASALSDPSPRDPPLKGQGDPFTASLAADVPRPDLNKYLHKNRSGVGWGGVAVGRGGGG